MSKSRALCREMLRWVCFIVLVTSSLLAGLNAIQNTVVAQAHTALVIPNPVYNLGEIGQGTVARGTFTISNPTEFRVELVDIATSCSCQNPKISNRYMAPGQEAIVALDWSIGNRRGRISDTAWVTYRFLDGSQDSGDLQLRMVATVIPDIVVEPLPVEFDAGGGIARLCLSPGRLNTFTIRSVYTNSKLITAKWHAVESVVEASYLPVASSLTDTGGLRITIETDSSNAYGTTT